MHHLLTKCNWIGHFDYNESHHIIIPEIDTIIKHTFPVKGAKRSLPFGGYFSIGYSTTSPELEESVHHIYSKQSPKMLIQSTISSEKVTKLLERKFPEGIYLS